MKISPSEIIETPREKLSAFGEEVLEGLSAHPRKISSKWFYDERGDELFQRIMAAPEYYLTESERSIFQQQAGAFLEATNGQPFDLVELGAGDGTKTQYLIEHFIDEGVDFRYLPIDISAHALDLISDLVNRRWPALDFHPVEGDYFQALNNLPTAQGPKRLKVVLFPGGNIGNFTPAAAAAFLTRLNLRLSDGDLLITGFDLKKNPVTILAAYNDAGGVTAQFNLNLLHRINRELGGDFDVSAWNHWPTYNPITGATRSFIVANRDQEVRIDALNKSFTFKAWEGIDLEISQKYSLGEIEALAACSGFRFERHLSDDSDYFVNSIWRVA
ncbi:L-histidine N(alpha)-methyltransferase [Lewinellaceae bacterium SD302]|nr:L-histidine N(alpha)-methyltransferase [Lewinellaceae bacterium SD302]